MTKYRLVPEGDASTTTTVKEGQKGKLDAKKMVAAGKKVDTACQDLQKEVKAIAIDSAYFEDINNALQQIVGALASINGAISTISGLVDLENQAPAEEEVVVVT